MYRMMLTVSACKGICPVLVSTKSRSALYANRYTSNYLHVDVSVLSLVIAPPDGELSA